MKTQHWHFETVKAGVAFLAYIKVSAHSSNNIPRDGCAIFFFYPGRNGSFKGREFYF